MCDKICNQTFKYTLKVKIMFMKTYQEVSTKTKFEGQFEHVRGVVSTGRNYGTIIKLVYAAEHI